METKKWNFDILNHELSNEVEYMYKPVHVLFENCTCRWVRTKHGPGAHGPPLWTGSMDHFHGPGPWTPCHGLGPWTVFLFL